MRLTVHLTGAKKEKTTVMTKNGPVVKEFVTNTLSFSDINPNQVGSILSQIEAEGLGTPTKHYLSGEKIKGLAKVRKKKS